MYNRILIPLDGSELSERALPLAADIGGRTGASLTLASVIDAEAEAAQSASEKYLIEVAGRLDGAGIEISMVTLTGDPAEEIVGHAEREGIDLIAMATRGRSGLVRGLLGSVTDRVIHSSTVPVLIVRPETAPEFGGEAPNIGQVVVPLDGSDFAEAALPHGQALAKALSARIVLMRSVRYPVAYSAAADPTVELAEVVTVEELEKEARDYLAAVSERVASNGLPVETRVGTGHPRGQLVALAEELPESIVVMTTHGASGMKRWMLGSVADGVIRTAPVPALIIPLRD